MNSYLDLETWPRREQFDWFRSYERPFFNICAPVDVTRFGHYCKDRGAPYSPAYHFLSIRAANEIEPFRYRLRGDQVLVHDRIHVGTTVPVDAERFVFAYAEYTGGFSAFLANFERERLRIQSSGGHLEPRDEVDDLVHYSVLPWISFTGLSHARRDDPQDSVPKIVFGKTYESAGKILMPHAVDAHHALMDGLHVGRYFERFQQLLDEPERSLI